MNIRACEHPAIFRDFLSKSLSEEYSSDFIGLRVSAGEEPGAGRCLVHRSSPVTLPKPAASRPEVTLAMAPASLAATRDALHRVPAAASHLLIAKVMKFLEYFSDRL